ncbi:5'-AMP-activated protein kinase subunit gamma-2 isoform X2 [Ixodes scapularis]
MAHGRNVVEGDEGVVGGVSLVVPRIVTTSDWGAMDPSSEACDAAGDLRFKASTMPASVASSERRRSLSGGTHRVPSLQLSGAVSGRARRQSGDDVLGGVSPSRKAVLFDAFRPRSKSDSKSSSGRKPNNLMSALRNTVHGHGWFPSASHHRGSSGGSPALTPQSSSLSPTSPPDGLMPCDLGPGFRRPRSGSESRPGAVSKVMDLFRNRSQSVSVEAKGKVRVATRHFLVDERMGG